MTEPAQGPCPLCASTSTQPYHRDKTRAYHQCRDCLLVFVDPQFWLTANDERAEYEKHNNTPSDEGYRRFLSRVTVPLLERLPPQSSGLDFGCGPGPTLSVMLGEHGHRVQNYDPFFYPTPLGSEYDFITATEVVEHLHTPGPTLMDVFDRLNAGGLLAIMTKRVKNQQAFTHWHYIRDPTHVCFFHAQSFEWLGRQWNCEPEFVSADVVLFTRPYGK